MSYLLYIRKTAVSVVKNIFKILNFTIKKLSKIINDILCNVVKFKSAYCVGYTHNFIKLMILLPAAHLLT